jgi:hypothetical protein
MRGRTIDLAQHFPIQNRSPLMRSVFRQYAARAGADTSDLAITGLRGALEESDIGALATVERHRASLSRSMGAWYSLQRVISEKFRNTSPAAVTTLARLTAPAPDRDLRVAAATALAAIHTKEALPHLAALLDDPDRELQALGVGGLAMFANNIPIGLHHPAPGEWKYRTEETMRNSVMSADVIARDPGRYLGFWKTWWAAHRAELTAR